MSLLAYFISYHTYGTWLHGHAHGSVDRDHNIVGTPYLPPDVQLEMAEARRLKHPPIKLDRFRRFVVDATIREVTNHRRWTLHSLNVRTTHVHMVVTAPGYTPERAMNDFKSYATRRMVEARVLPANTKAWCRHGSTKYIDTPESFGLAMRYVVDEQGTPLPMSCPEGWVPRYSPHEPRP